MAPPFVKTLFVKTYLFIICYDGYAVPVYGYAVPPNG
jgi:hypothetical protein